MYAIKKVDKKSKAKVISFLENYKETSLFLLGNMNSYGLHLTDHMNSGNYKYIEKNNAVIAVFCLTKRRNLLLQTDGKDNYSELIFDACKEETVTAEGILGEWEAAKTYWDLFCARVPNFHEITLAKENLYKLDLCNYKEENPEKGHVRLLTDTDFTPWDELNKTFTLELGITIQGTEKERQLVFSENTEKKFLWGLFIENELISTAEITMRYKDTGQIGGVYTMPDKRRLGYSRYCISRLLDDSKKLHNFKELILFTNEDNIAANKLYESFGFQKIGSYGLLYGKYN